MPYTLNPFTKKLDFYKTSANPGGDIATITGNSGGAVGPDGSGNITMTGSNGVLFAGNAGTNSFNVTQTYTTKYVVGATSSNYTTIVAAIAAAVADGASFTTPKTIYVQPGTYNENLTVPSGIIIVGYDAVCVATTVFQPALTQVQAVKLTGSITFNTSAIAANTYASIQNIWITPATGNAVTASGNLAAGFDQLLYFKGCRIETTASSTYCFNITNMEIVHQDCFIYDNTVDTTGYYFTCAGDTNQAFLSCVDSLVYTGVGATAAVMPANSAPNVRIQGSVFAPSIDATNSASYSFRMVNSVHASTGITNLTPYHVTGASTTGRIIYDNSNITMADTTINVATIGFASFIIEFNDCNFGNLFAASSDKVSGGRQIFTNCGIQSGSTTYYNRNDMIKVGYSGASKFNFQASATTSDATVTTLGSVVVNEGESITMSGTISAQKSDSTDACGGNFLITARRATAGNITLVGTPVVNVNSTSTATFTVEVDTGTQTVRIRVTGIAATTYYWVTDYSYQKVLTSS